MNSEHVVIGIDGGGTYTRVMICDLWGHVLSFVERGSASIYKDEKAAQNVQGAIAEALRQANRTNEQVVALVAGIAGYDAPSDLEWITPLTELPGLSCPKWHVNDAVSAHSGALMGKPGIVVIAGTGSIIVGSTEDGQFIRNYDFHHYAVSAARSIAYDAVYEMLAGGYDETDRPLLLKMLEHFGVQAIDQLAEAAKKVLPRIGASATNILAILLLSLLRRLSKEACLLSAYATVPSLKLRLASSLLPLPSQVKK